MSHRLGTYTFLPWLRQGIANQISAADLDPTVSTRASVDVTVRLTGEPVGGGAAMEQDISREIQLYGPGDIVGIDTRAIVRTEPRNRITNFETNFMPFIEFYDEDFPWRFTPATRSASNASRLRPWIMLVVLKEDEFTDGRNVSGKPLPFIVVPDPSVFPPVDELWAWAHVHVNRALISDPDDVLVEANQNAAALAEFENVLNENPDLAYSRIVCPRMLEENTGYHAFLVPVFESGRLAGLGLEPDAAPFATFSAWEPYPSGTRAEPDHYPHYFRSYFRTSTVGDFEYLVRLLEPKPMDGRVGRRDIDVQNPGANLPGITDSELGGVLKLGGALQIPFDTMKPEDQADVTKYENWDEPYPHDFQLRLAEFVNLQDEYAEKAAADAHDDTQLPEIIKTDPNPLITAPLYGRWHALMQRLLKDRQGDDVENTRNWVHELNLDPRFRVAAGFGTRVVQESQETYMESAWEQVGDVVKANREIRWAQMAKGVSWAWYAKHLVPLQETGPDKFFALTAPVDKRVVLNSPTRYFVQQSSFVPRVVVSAPMRRVIRSRGALMKTLDFRGEFKPEELVTRLNARKVLPAPPKETPPELQTTDSLADALQPRGLPGLLLRLLGDASWLRFLLLPLALVLLVLLVVLVGPGLGALSLSAAALGTVGVLAVGALLFLFVRLNRAVNQLEVSESLREDNQTPEAVDDLPTSSDFVLTLPAVEYTPRRGGEDSPTATRFKSALKDAFTLMAASKTVSEQPPKLALDLPAINSRTLEALDPAITIPRRTLGRVFIPPRIADQLAEVFEEAMAYPEFDTPMYKPLTDISADLFLPNIQFIEENSISLLETNQRFIEAYLVGLNHEFARELLWREYPTDQRGSYFRQFWDVSSFLDREGSDPETLRERLRDIPPLHRWPKASELGDHDHRELPGESEEELVLVIRGELLKKYPTAVIFAQRAEWQTKPDGSIDRAQPRVLVTLSEAEEINPPPEKVRTPLYEAKVDPDIYFFGFDLTATEAKGETEEDPDDPGWFFVIKERPGEPRFGLDIEQDGGTKHHWNDLSWEDALPGGVPGNFLAATAPPAVTLVPPPASASPEVRKQHEEDVQIRWDASVSAAELAYILYQVPVLVAVHASEMLPE